MRDSMDHKVSKYLLSDPVQKSLPTRYKRQLLRLNMYKEKNIKILKDNQVAKKGQLHYLFKNYQKDK